MEHVLYQNLLLCNDISKRLNLKKILILQELSKECSLKVLRKIVLGNSFLVNCDPICYSLLKQCDHMPQRSVEKITRIMQERLHEDDIINDHSKDLIATMPPLEMVGSYYMEKELYDTVRLLITCGADVNVMNVCNATAMSAFCRRNNDPMGIKTFRFVLKNGKNAVAALQHEDLYGILDIAISSTVRITNKIRVAKLLLEFGAKTEECTLLEMLEGRVLRKEKCDFMRLIQLFMQYLLINIFKYNLVKISELAKDGKYDEILDLSSCSNTIFYNEVVAYRNILIKEIIAMVYQKLDKTTTLFSFISKQCCSGLHYSENEESLLYKILTIYHLKQYNFSHGLFYASMKRAAMIPILCSLCIFVRNPSNEMVRLNSYVILHLASYLSRRDIFNLINIFLTYPIKKERLQAIKCLKKRTNESFQNQINENSNRCDITSVVSFKRLKLNK